MIRTVVASYWTVGAAFIAGLAAHAFWFARTTHVGEVVSGLGAFVIGLGIWVASRPYLRKGLQPTIIAALPLFPFGVYGSEQGMQDYRNQVDAARPGITRDVWAERVIAVAAIVIGTGLNGYGAPLARLLGLEHQS